jgi:hypothetical protein
MADFFQGNQDSRSICPGGVARKILGAPLSRLGAFHPGFADITGAGGSSFGGQAAGHKDLKKSWVTSWTCRLQAQVHQERPNFWAYCWGPQQGLLRGRQPKL